jgi:hypothetical protein
MRGHVDRSAKRGEGALDVGIAEKADASRAAVAVNLRVGRDGRTTSVSGSDQDESLASAAFVTADPCSACDGS